MSISTIMATISNKIYTNQIYQQLVDTTYNNCTFDSCRITRQTINCQFNNCTIKKCTFSGDTFSNITSTGSIITDTLFNVEFMDNCQFNNCTIKNIEFFNITNITNISFSGVPAKNIKIRNTRNFTDTIIEGCGFMIDWEKGILEGLTLDNEVFPKLIGTQIKTCSAKSCTIKNLRSCMCTQTNFTQLNSFQCLFEYSTFIDCDFTNSDFQYGNLNHGVYVNCKFNESNMENCDMSYSVFIDCDFTDVNMEYVDLQYCNINGCIFDNTIVDNINFNSTSIANSIITNVDFSNVDNFELFFNKSRILPNGSLIGWGKYNDIIVEFEIPEDAQRTNTFIRTCRSDKVIIKNIEGASSVVINGSPYNIGDTVLSSFDSNPNITDGDGIYFYITKYEAENS